MKKNQVEFWIYNNACNLHNSRRKVKAILEKKVNANKLKGCPCRIEDGRLKEWAIFMLKPREINADMNIPEDQLLSRMNHLEKQGKVKFIKNFSRRRKLYIVGYYLSDLDECGGYEEFILRDKIE